MVKIPKIDEKLGKNGGKKMGKVWGGNEEGWVVDGGRKEVENGVAIVVKWSAVTALTKGLKKPLATPPLFYSPRANAAGLTQECCCTHTLIPKLG